MPFKAGLRGWVIVSAGVALAITAAALTVALIAVFSLALAVIYDRKELK